ncbi:MAG: hypothetical protein K2X43_04415 [Hyphomonadaceae bacterium]|nr:hypothetical protein [Hyphomonadaceae bacterium]
MRRPLALVALALPMAVWAAPTLALDRLPQPGAAASAVVPVADLDRPLPAPARRPARAEADWHWRYRAAYTRWVYNEYVRAGYPVRHRQFRTYARAYDCCRRYRHW